MLELSCNLHSLEKKIEFNDSIITCSTNSPIPKKCLRQYVSKGIRNSELLEMMTNPALWPHSKQITKELTDIVQFDWLPQDLIIHSERLVSILNSVGNVELYVQKRLKWDCIADVSLLMNKYLLNENNMEVPKEFNELKQYVYKIETSAIGWCPHSNNDNTCYFVTAMKSARLIFWLLTLGNDISIQYCGEIEQEYSAIISKIYWLSLQNSFLLVTCNELGQIVAYDCSIEDNKIKNTQTKVLWPHTDKMVPISFHYYLYDDKIIILFNKHRHFLVQMFDRNMELLSQYVESVNDFKIVCITQKHNVFYLCTENVKMYTIDICIDDKKLNVVLNEIKIKDMYPGHELCSLAISENKALYALAMVDQRVQHRKLQLKVDVVLLCAETEIDAHITKIIQNPAKTLSNMWDQIEVLRLKTMKTKTLPKMDYKKLLKEGEKDVYKLKVYYVFLTLYYNLQKYVVKKRKRLLPELSIDKIKTHILKFQAIKTLTSLYERLQDGKELSEFDQQSFDGCKKFIQYYCEKYSKCITDLIPQNILNSVTTNIQHVCQCCDEELIGLTCKSNHLNMFCSLTFTPIVEMNYLICKVCGMTAQYELHKLKPLCPLCDRYLSDSLLPL
ncbi:unnamed protein product [Danaus chrysippus]|uniref:(African queen) hypothetical protein n=1 Tax=Danaus chrysippus TaxID=151541 RepID=A0A8J2VPX1_9NEOP|nr:unnamed protein product [Danaus chrysippus]